MARHIAQRAVAVQHITTPVFRQEAVIVFVEWRGADPQVIMNVRRNGFGLRRRLGCAPAFAAPDMHFGDRADDAGFDDFDNPPIVALGVNLRAHLRDAIVFCGQFLNHARFVHGMRERLFAIDMLVEAKRRRRRDGMDVIGRGDHDGVNVLLLKRLSEIVVRLCAWEFLGGGRQIIFIDVAKSNHIDQAALKGFVKVVGGLMVRADECDIQFLICRGGLSASPCAATGDPEPDSGCRAGFDEIPAIYFSSHDATPVSG